MFTHSTRFTVLGVASIHVWCCCVCVMCMRALAVEISLESLHVGGADCALRHPTLVARRSLHPGVEHVAVNFLCGVVTVILLSVGRTINEAVFPNAGLGREQRHLKPRIALLLQGTFQIDGH